MLKTCWTNEGRRLVSLLSALCDLHRMNWGWRPRVTSSGASTATKSHSEHLPPLLRQQIHSGLLSLPPFLFSDLWPLFFLSIQTLSSCSCCFSSLLVPPLLPVLIFFFSFFPQIVICGQRESPDTVSLLAAVSSLFHPHKVSVLSNDVSSWQMRVSSFGRAALKRNDHRAAKARALIYSDHGAFTVAAH